MNASTLIAQALRIAPLIGLVSLRVAVVFALMPAPFGELAPVRVRAALSFMVAFVIALPTLGDASSLSVEPAQLLLSALTELIVGAVIGLTVRVTLAVAEIAGTLAGNAMGLGFAQHVDPLFGSEGVPTSSLIGSLGVLIFFVLRGHHVVLEALSASLTLAPCGGGFPSMNPARLALLGTRMVAQGLRIASPVVATMFVVQLGTALVARAAPRVQVFALSFGVSVSIGALVLLMCAPEVAQGLAALVHGIADHLVELLPRGAR